MGSEFEVTLRQSALVSIASSFWRRDDIQIMFKQYLYPYVRRGKGEFLAKLIKEVMKKVEPNSLPSVLYSEVLLAIKETGHKMANWFFYLRRRKAFRNIPRRELYDQFFKDVYFTHYGTIDEIKILKQSWMNIPNVDLGILYIMACYSCSEPLINELWEKMASSENQFYSYEHLCSRLGFHLVAYWNKRRENDLQGFYNDCIVRFAGGDPNIYDPSKSVDVNMFRLSVAKGYVRAVKFFGSKISREEKEKNVVFCLTYVMDSFYEKHEWEFHRREQCTEICLYLSNFLTEQTIKAIFQDIKISTLPEYSFKTDYIYFDTYSQMFICMWPWQECFKYVFNLVKDMIHEEQYCSLLSNIIQAFCANVELGVAVENSIFQSQLRQVWHSIPPPWKASISENLDIQSLFRCDMSCAQLIINDKQTVSKREALIEKFRTGYLNIVKDGKQDILRELINKILISSEWDENVQETIKSLYGKILDGDLNSIDELLEPASQEEMTDLKSKIDHELMCYYLISKNEFELADKFLKWKFGRRVDVAKFKSTFHDKDFTIGHIRNLWKTNKENVASAKMKSDQFLFWFMKTEIEIIPFKLKHFVNEIFKESSFDYQRFIDRDNFEILEDFLYWCGLNKDAFQLTKKYIIKKILEHFIHECMKRNSIDEADKLLKWAFDTEEEKNAFMHRALTGTAHIAMRGKSYYMICSKLYIGKYWHFDMFSPKPTREEMTENFTKFINFFLKPYLKNFDDLKSLLKIWPEISESSVERIREDDPSTDEYYSGYPEDHDEFFEHLMYCEKENCDLFLTLLDSMEK